MAAGLSLLQEGEQPGVRELVGCQGQVGVDPGQVAGAEGSAVSPALGGLQALFHEGTQQLLEGGAFQHRPGLQTRKQGIKQSRVVRMGGRIRVSA